jgi:hypothetical protein
MQVVQPVDILAPNFQCGTGRTPFAGILGIFLVNIIIRQTGSLLFIPYSIQGCRYAAASVNGLEVSLPESVPKGRSSRLSQAACDRDNIQRVARACLSLSNVDPR